MCKCKIYTLSDILWLAINTTNVESLQLDNSLNIVTILMPIFKFKYWFRSSCTECRTPFAKAVVILYYDDRVII